MKLTVVLAVLSGILVLACSSAAPAPAEPTRQSAAALPYQGAAPALPKPTPSPKPTAVPENVDVARLVIDLPDLPEGFVITEERNVDNKEGAKSHRDSDAALEGMEFWGRVLGYTVEFEKGILGERSQVDASVYATEAGATKTATFEENMWEQRL